jgi:cytoskeleton protein RodZ
MAAISEQLQLAREEKKLTIHQVAEVTKIRTDHIRALEEGNFDVFSAPVYIKGFVRSYATLLKLDVPKIMAGLDEELGRTDKFHEPPPLSDQPRGVVDFITLQLSKLNRRKATIIIGSAVALIVVIIGIAALASRKTTDPSAGITPGVYHSGQSGETLPLPAPHR